MKKVKQYLIGIDCYATMTIMATSQVNARRQFRENPELLETIIQKPHIRWNRSKPIFARALE